VEHVPISSQAQLRQTLSTLVDLRRPVLLELDAAAFLSA